MQDLEEDPELRSRINLYGKPNAKKGSTEAMQDSDEDDDFPEIQLGELLTACHYKRQTQTRPKEGQWRTMALPLSIWTM